MLGDVKFATFDLSPEVLQAITDGDMLFAIDQAQYLQGYLPIVFLTKYLETGALPLGSVDRVVLTGPQIVTADTAQDVVAVLGGGAPLDGHGVGAHAVGADLVPSASSGRIIEAAYRARPSCEGGPGMATTATEPTADSDERVRRVGAFSRLLGRPELGAIAGLIVVWVFFAIIAADNNFVGMATTASILNRAAPLGILAVAVALLMIAGEFDLSIGSILGFSGMAIMIAVTPVDAGGLGWSLLPAAILALVLALTTGFINGWLVVLTKLPSFIITLGTLFIFRGLTTAITRARTNRTQLGNLDEVPGFALFEKWFGREFEIIGAHFSISILWWILLTAIATWILVRTRSGNWIFGTGGAPDAARAVGVPVRRVKIALFLTTAFAAFFVAMTQVVQFTGADTLRGTGREFEAIIAAVVGGCLLTGGYGSAVGAALGALIFAMVQQGIVITGIDGDWYQVFIGAVLLAAVIFNNFVRRKAASR